MAENLPNFILIRSISNPRSRVWYEKDNEQRLGYLRCEEDTVLNPLAKIQVESSKTDNRYVHFRFVHVNKYWAKPANNHLLVAESDQPEEDLSKPTCTLIQPFFSSNGTVGLRHVQSNRGIASFIVGGANSFLGAQSSNVISNFTIVDWDTLVTLPTHVAFKGHNDKYVRDAVYHGMPYLQTSSEDPNRVDSGYEVQQLPDGHVRIKSLNFDRYWRRESNWIWSDNNDNDGRNRETLFWPVQIDDKTIALQHAGNNNFIKPLSADFKADCLNADVPNITLETRFQVEELVFHRDIYNVIYRMEDARIYDEEPFLAGVATATNLSNDESSLAITVAYEDSFSYTFTNSLSITAGVASKITVGIPKIGSGKIRVSTEITKGFEWNRTTEEKKTVTAQHTVTVPPKSRARVSYVGTQGKCSIPFSYTRRDKRSTNGQMIISQHIDGIYSGVNYYNFQFEVTEIEHL